MNNDNNFRLNIILADDDPDDRFFFSKALKDLNVDCDLVTLSNGEKLMYYLENTQLLADVLFLDLNMPRKNGYECLLEIKGNERIRDLPVIIYTTSLSPEVADVLHSNGAMYYVQKGDFDELLIVMQVVLNAIIEKRPLPKRKEFILTGRNQHKSSEEKAC